MNNNEFRVLILLTLQNALLGEISVSLRGVACSWDTEVINLYAFFDGSISEDDLDSMECVETELISACYDQSVNLKCVQLDYPQPFNLDSTVTWVYKRKEKA